MRNEASMPAKVRLRFTPCRLVIAASLAIYLGSVGCSDRFDGWNFFPWVSFNTAFAERYDESKFRRVRAGMSSEEVASLIGKPLFKVEAPAGESYAHYSKAIDSGCYLVRIVVARDAIVRRLIHERYCD